MEISTNMELITADILTAEFVRDLREPCTSDVNGEICRWIIRRVRSSVFRCSPSLIFTHNLLHIDCQNIINAVVVGNFFHLSVQPVPKIYNFQHCPIVKSGETPRTMALS